MVTSRTTGGEDAESAQARVERMVREYIANGTYPLRGRVPSQRKLAEEFAVSRDTVQRALGRLAEEGLVAPEAGSGTRVIGVPDSLPAAPQSPRPGSASLGPLIEQAFRQGDVKLEVASLTAETLLRHLRNQYEQIAREEAPLPPPRRLRIDLLLPWTEEPLAYPRAKSPQDARIWERWRGMVRENRIGLEVLLDAYAGRGVDTHLEIRRTPMTPQFKLYVINDEHMLFGPYPVLSRRIRVPHGERPEEDEAVDSLDVLGLGSALSYHRLEAEDRTHDSLFFISMRDWFTSNWERWPEVLRSDRESDRTGTVVQK